MGLVEREGDLLTIAYESTEVRDKPGGVKPTSSTGRFVIALADPLPRSGSFAMTVPVTPPGSANQVGAGMELQLGWAISEHEQAL